MFGFLLFSLLWIYINFGNLFIFSEYKVTKRTVNWYSSNFQTRLLTSSYTFSKVFFIIFNALKKRDRSMSIRYIIQYSPVGLWANDLLLFRILLSFSLLIRPFFSSSFFVDNEDYLSTNVWNKNARVPTYNGYLPTKIAVSKYF